MARFAHTALPHEIYRRAPAVPAEVTMRPQPPELEPDAPDFGWTANILPAKMPMRPQPPEPEPYAPDFDLIANLLPAEMTMRPQPPRPEPYAPDWIANLLPAEMTMRPRPPEPEPYAPDFDWIAILGRGGFARVYKVRDRRTGDVLALKEAFAPSRHAGEEIEVLRRVAGSPSPFVVQCHAVFLGDNDALVSVLEFMDAGSLLSVLCRRRRRGIPEPALAEVASRCLMGLAQLHSRGVAHLDVKPDNFLANSSGEVKINDFNTSRIVFGPAGERLVVPTVMGTTAYFSPERFEPSPRADPRGAMAADVWGLGLTILELLLGRLPIVPDVEFPKAQDWKEVICDRRPPSVPHYVEASAELREFVDACLQKDPAQRARVPQLLRHPLVTRRDVATSSLALRELIVETL